MFVNKNLTKTFSYLLDVCVCLDRVFSHEATLLKLDIDVNQSVHSITISHRLGQDRVTGDQS